MDKKQIIEILEASPLGASLHGLLETVFEAGRRVGIKEGFEKAREACAEAQKLILK